MFIFEQMVWWMGKFLNSHWWVGVFYAFCSASWWGIWPSKLPRNLTKNFQKSQMPGVLRKGSMGGFRICQYKMQTTDCCRPLFSPRNQNETKIVPLTVFKPWKQWSAVSLQSTFYTVQFWNGLVHWLGNVCINNLTLTPGMVVSTKFQQTQESLPLIYLAL